MNGTIRRHTLQMFSNGVYIMTSRSGNRLGAATVTWVSQASFKPPLIMVALRKSGNVFQCLLESACAAVHVVGIHQLDLARKFFSPTAPGIGEINGEPFMDGKTSAPILQNLPAYVECRVHDIVGERGDHAVVVMEIVEAECREKVRPLTMADTPWEYCG